MQFLPTLTSPAPGVTTHATLGELRRYALRPTGRHLETLLQHLTYYDACWFLAQQMQSRLGGKETATSPLPRR